MSEGGRLEHCNEQALNHRLNQAWSRTKIELQCKIYIFIKLCVTCSVPTRKTPQHDWKMAIFFTGDQRSYAYHQR